MTRFITKYWSAILLFFAVCGVFAVRTLLSGISAVPRTNDLFTLLVLLGAAVVVLRYLRSLRTIDFVIALGVGLLVGVPMLFASLFTPYDFFGIVKGNLAQALARGVCTAVAMLGGLVILRQGGPVRLALADTNRRKVFTSFSIGLGIGLPLAVLNVFALRLTQGHPVMWQDLGAALLDALQPAVVEEVVYRFCLLGLFWLALRRSLPMQAGWMAGGLALLVHNFIHFDDLWLQNPLMALGMGAVMAIVWGLPPTLLALRRDIESAAAFHWIQDALRFLAGY